MLIRLPDLTAWVSFGTYDYALEVYIDYGSQLEHLGSDFDHVARPIIGELQKDKKYLQLLVEEWNKVYPIGTNVTSDFYETELENRTETMLFFGNRAAVYLTDYNEYFDLREVTGVT